MKIVSATALAFAALMGSCQATFMNENGQFLKILKQKQWEETAAFAANTRANFPSTRNAAAACDNVNERVFINGEAFPCKNIDFEGFINLNDFDIAGRTNAGSDIWGWVDGDGREITLMTTNNGLWFVDSTDPANPTILGSMPALSSRGSSWSDVKVYKDTAYMIKDAASPDNGIQVFDLTQLNGLQGFPPSQVDSAPVFSATTQFTGHGDSHNVLIDNDSGYLFSVGSNMCRGGLYIVNLEPNPLDPQFVTCVSEDGYTHDAQCVVYDGPDARYFNKELCFAFNEDTLTIWDVTDKSDIELIARERYDGVAYSHQGWLTADMKWLLLDDELDESRDRDKRTKTMIVNIEDLRNPVFESKIIHDYQSIDHNLYFWGPIHEKGWGGNPPVSNPPLPQYAYLSNYASGIQVVDMKEIANGIVRRPGYFDVAPEFNSAAFHGTWSNYMHPSGVLAVSSIERGLFLLRPRMAFQEITGEVMNTVPMTAAAAEPIEFVPTTEDSSDDNLANAVLGLTIVVGAALVVMPLSAYYFVKKTQKKEEPEDGAVLQRTL